MSMLLVQVPVSAVVIDEARSPDADRRLLLDHLIRYCARFEPLPAITLAVEGNTAMVVRGHKYLLAARALGRPTIRAVISPPIESAAVQAFLARADVETLDWERIKADEASDPTPLGWQVFFFERALSPDEKADFDRRARGLFAGTEPQVEVLHDDDGPVAELLAPVPVGDHAWARRHLEAFTGFSNERVKIVSFQGARFGQ